MSATATTADPRPLADLEQDALAAVEEEMARRARGARPWTTSEYVDRIARVHAHYEQRRTWLRRDPDADSRLAWADDRARLRPNERPLWRTVRAESAEEIDL